MAQQATAGRLNPLASVSEPLVVPEMTIRVTGALLALGIAAAHVADQGGITPFTSPNWLGWANRFDEVGGVVTALTLMWPRSGKLGWAAGVLLGLAPFLGYMASRTVG